MISKLLSLLNYLFAYGITITRSYLKFIISLTKSPKIYFEKEYNNQAIVILALYKKGRIRKDIENLLYQLKQKNVYIICVNSKKLKVPEDYNNLIDCYIERYNYGRDFGNYKSAFLFLYKKKFHLNNPRTILLNDSVFYTKRNLNKFVNDLIESEIEVLSATENHSISSHLGSFCISISGEIIRHQRFIKFWKTFRNSDIRPVCIKKGEFGLSKVLKNCVSSEEHYKAMFDINFYRNYIKHNDKIVEDFLYYSISPQKLSNFLLDDIEKKINKNIINTDTFSNYTGNFVIDENSNILNSLVIPQIGSFQAISSFLPKLQIKIKDDSLKEIITQSLIETCSKHSQIHLCNHVFLDAGLPIIKLDGYYRGLFSDIDIQKIINRLDKEESISFSHLTYSTPFGEYFLKGWKKTAFLHHLE